MAHPLELAEPNVIDEDLIRNCITTVEEIKISEEKKKELRAQTELHDIKALSFSFQNILKIDNLNGLHSLVKLQLDNNIIETIENIGHLTNLEWLDLSFNNITVIQGLEPLVKLTDLSLFNNRIVELQGLTTLTALNCLSVGNNKIENIIHAVNYLRQFRNLRMINMAGNDCSKDPEYYTRIIAHLRDIVYVDYRLVDPEKVQQAKEQYQDELFEILEEEKKKAEEEHKNAEAFAFLQQLRDANVEGANTLLQAMLEDDSEQSKLSTLSFWLEIIDECQHEFKTLSQEFIDNVLGNSGKTTRYSTGIKVQERERFRKVLADSRAKIDTESKGLVHKFDARKKKLLRLIDELNETEAIKKLRELQEANVQLNDDLLELELRQMEQDDQIISEFERLYGELVNSFIEAVQNEFCAKLRDVENAFFLRAMQMAQEELERFAAGQLDEVTEDAAIFLSDKEIVLASLNASHDAHVSVIDSWEEAVVTRERKNYQALIAQARADSIARDRRRVLETVNITERNNREIEDLIQNEDAR